MENGELGIENGEITCDERERGRDDEGCGEIRKEGESGEVLYRAAHLTGNDRSRCSRRHDETHEDTLRENIVTGERKDSGI